MARALAFVLALFAFSSAQAAPFRPCPFVTIGWSQQYGSGPISSVLYDSAAQLLYVIFGGTAATAYSNVPTSVMTGFSNTSNPSLYYTNAVAYRYHPLLLQEQDNCPILFVPAVSCVLRNEDGTPLLSQKNQPLLGQPPACPAQIEAYLWLR